MVGKTLLAMVLAGFSAQGYAACPFPPSDCFDDLVSGWHKIHDNFRDWYEDRNDVFADWYEERAEVFLNTSIELAAKIEAIREAHPFVVVLSPGTTFAAKRITEHMNAVRERADRQQRRTALAIKQVTVKGAGDFLVLAEASFTAVSQEMIDTPNFEKALDYAEKAHNVFIERIHTAVDVQTGEGFYYDLKDDLNAVQRYARNRVSEERMKAMLTFSI